jgi:hypothetical protein
MHLRFTFLLLFAAASLSAQRLEWLSPTDCGQLINVRKMSADAQGNVYVGGEYDGELAVGADRNDTVISKYGGSWQKSFLVRYNSAGTPTFVSQFKSTGGNSNLTYVQAVKALPAGECLVFISCRGPFDFVDPYGVHAKAGENGRGANLFCINSNGTLKWSRAVNIDNVTLLETANDGSIYITGTWNANYAASACLLSFTASGTPTDTLLLSGPGISALQVSGEYLLIGVSSSNSNYTWRASKTVSPLEIGKDHFAVFRMHRITGKTEKLFEQELPMREGYQGGKSPSSLRMTFNTSSGELWTDCIVGTEYGATEFLGERYVRTEGNMHIVRLNEKGERLLDRAFDCMHYNTQLVTLDNGCSALMVAAYGTSFRYGSDSLQLPDHAMFINELVVLKLDRNLNKLWWFTAGATASNYHTSQLIYNGNGQFFMASDLMAAGTVLGRKLSTPWSSAMYVMRFRE